jgi:hypothetical protein
MGWESASNWNNKKQVVDELTGSLKRSGFSVLGEKSTNDGVWYVVEKEQKRFIYFGLIKKEMGEFALKTMSEDMGPSYYSCPVKFFTMAGPATSEYAKAWRESIIAREERKNRKIEVGMVVKLYGETYEISGQHYLGKGMAWVIQNALGQKYKLKKSQIAELEIVEVANA